MRFTVEMPAPPPEGGGRNRLGAVPLVEQPPVRVPPTVEHVFVMNV